MKILITLALFFNLTNGYGQDLHNPEYNFDYLWHDYKDNYKMFQVKHINWDSLYQVYRPMVHPNTTDVELFFILSQLMSHLDDSHCWLDNRTLFYKSGTNVTYALSDWEEYWQRYHVGNFSLNLIRASYLVPETFNIVLEDYQYGWLPDSIGYFHCDQFRNPFTAHAIMDTILTEFNAAKGLIIDIRGNAGGDSRIVKIILDRFTDQRRLYVKEDSAAYSLYTADRKFNKKRYTHTEPQGTIRYTKAVVVLTDKTSYSSADIMASGFKEMPQATLIGDTTNGCTAYMFNRKLPNGMTYTITMGIAYTASWECLDGIGIAPDIWIQNNSDDIIKGVDRVLEAGIRELKYKTFYRNKAVDYSLVKTMPTSIEEVFLNLLYLHQYDSALVYFRQQMKDNKALCEQTISERYISYAGWDFMDYGDINIAKEIFLLNHKLFPYAPNTLLDLKYVYTELNDQKQLKKVCRKLKKLNPDFQYNIYMPPANTITPFKE